MKIKNLETFEIEISKVEIKFDEQDSYYNGIILDLNDLKGKIMTKNIFCFALNNDEYRNELNRIFKTNFTLETDITQELFENFDISFSLGCNEESGCFSFITINVSKGNINDKTIFSYDVPNIDFNKRHDKNFKLLFCIKNLNFY